MTLTFDFPAAEVLPSWKLGPDLPCAGCTMGGGPRCQPSPTINCQIFTTLFWRLNVQMMMMMMCN